MIARLLMALGAALLVLTATFTFATGTVSGQETVTVDVGDTYFCDPSFQGGTCTTTVSAGDTVVWDFAPGTLPHSSTECGGNCASPGTPLWDSGIVADGTFQRTFDQAGTFAYYCQVHGAAAMQGQVVVQGASQQPTPVATTPAAAPADDRAAPTSTPSGIVIPATGGATSNGLSDSWWPVAVLGAGGAVLLALGAFGYRKRGP
jgi:plastocyanin